MKRSDFINQLTQWMQDNTYRHGYRYDCDYVEQYEVRILLDKLEQMGMLPPGHLKPVPKGEELIPGDFPLNDGTGRYGTPGVNEWEPEND